LIQFLLNGEPQHASLTQPGLSLLDWLRDERQLTGSKEGCASGDCGACTAAIGTVDSSGAIHYRSVNACITPLASLQGRHIITVEGLKQGGKLHPSQQAMVDCHGSQCGFCTPGFVMSMFVLGREHDSAPETEEIHRALGGNLCRCTGYRPIVDACVQMFDPATDTQNPDAATKPTDDFFSTQEDDWALKLAAIQLAPQMATAAGQFLVPVNSDELAALLQRYPDARMIAGGTDLSIELTQQLAEIETLIDTTRVSEMNILTQDSDQLIIGAALPYSDFSNALLAQFPELDELLARLGSKQIRNRGTLGGNIGNASPIADMPPVLIALGAELILSSVRGRRRIALEDFYQSYKVTSLAAGEFIEQIIIPNRQAGSVLRTYKISKRFEDDISSTCGAFYLPMSDGQIAAPRIAFGGMAAIPARATHTEQVLDGQVLSDTLVESAQAALSNDYSPIDDFRASGAYRLQVSQNMLKRLQLELAQGADSFIGVHQHA